MFNLVYVLTKGQVDLADERSVELLQVFSSDSEPIVAESCEVALHMLELEQQGKPFEVGCPNFWVRELAILKNCFGIVSFLTYLD